jgi:hypothetical protein
MKTLNITDYKLISKDLAKVIISTTGDLSPTEIQDTVAEKMNYLGAAVKGSFRKVQKGVAVGFVRANTPVRILNKGDASSYRALSANVLMDETDHSLWDVTEGSAGKYLTRQGREDLSALCASVRVRQPDLPGFHRIELVAAAAGEMVTFVDENGDLDHGFAVGHGDNKVEVMSTTRDASYVCPTENIVQITAFEIDKSIAAQVKTLVADAKSDMKAYYSALFSYAPEYLQKVIKMIDESAIA